MKKVAKKSGSSKLLLLVLAGIEKEQVTDIQLSDNGIIYTKVGKQVQSVQAFKTFKTAIQPDDINLLYNGQFSKVSREFAQILIDNSSYELSLNIFNAYTKTLRGYKNYIQANSKVVIKSAVLKDLAYTLREQIRLKNMKNIELFVHPNNYKFKPHGTISHRKKQK